jgi:hypothetical protein
LGSDLIYDGTPFLALKELMKKSLKKDGKILIIIPNDRGCK